MKRADVPVVKRSIFSWVFADNLKLQILLVFIILVMVFARVVPLEMQKRIVNAVIIFPTARYHARRRAPHWWSRPRRP